MLPGSDTRSFVNFTPFSIALNFLTKFKSTFLDKIFKSIIENFF